VSGWCRDIPKGHAVSGDGVDDPERGQRHAAGATWCQRRPCRGPNSAGHHQHPAGEQCCPNDSQCSGWDSCNHPHILGRSRRVRPQYTGTPLARMGLPNWTGRVPGLACGKLGLARLCLICMRTLSPPMNLPTPSFLRWAHDTVSQSATVLTPVLVPGAPPVTLSTGSARGGGAATVVRAKTACVFLRSAWSSTFMHITSSTGLHMRGGTGLPRVGTATGYFLHFYQSTIVAHCHGPGFSAHAVWLATHASLCSLWNCAGSSAKHAHTSVLWPMDTIVRPSVAKRFVCVHLCTPPPLTTVTRWRYLGPCGLR
jgi:hypothetical protein